MKFTMSRPCPSCPFRCDVAFYLHPERRQEIAASLLFGDATFACHATVDYDRWEDEDGDEYHHSGDEQHCAGALIVLKRQGALFDNRMPRIAAMFGWFDPDGLDMTAEVFGSMEEFVEGEP